MPTGYTADVQSGKLTSFRDFAILCAHASGANIALRDSSIDAPIPEYQPEPYHRDEIEKARARLYDAERMTLIEAGVALNVERAKAEETIAGILANRSKERARYEAMLEQVRAWQPPTPDHVEMKKFMVNQLEESIRFDCGDHDPREYCGVKQETAAEYKQHLIDEARGAIDYHTKEWAKEQKRTQDRNAWNKALFASLPAENQ